MLSGLSGVAVESGVLLPLWQKEAETSSGVPSEKGLVVTKHGARQGLCRVLISWNVKT